MINKDPICGMPVDTVKTKFKTVFLGKEIFFCSESCMQSFLERPRIAYFSMEIGIRNEVRTYSGGLGVLAGDTIRSSADLKIPLVAVTLVSRKGYLKQKITADGTQLEEPDDWVPEKFMRLLPVEAKVKITGRDVKINTWLYEHQSLTGGVVPILFLDTDVEGNSAEDRGITDFLYGGDDRYRLKQEIVLGIGGIRILESLKFTFRNYHMNEGHSSLLTLELLKDNAMNVDRVREACVFTTHTPVAAAFDKFQYDLVTELLGDTIPIEILKKYGGEDRLNMTLLALNLSKYVNGVSKRAMEYSEELFPGHLIRSVTNGVHSYTWTSPFFRIIFHRYIPGWANEPQLLMRVNAIPNDEIWGAHVKAKGDLINFISKKTGEMLDASHLTLGFARRATEYKRATLILSDIQRLREINKKEKIQLVFAGKAHPRDDAGKRIIKEIYNYKVLLKDEIKIVYLENYDMETAAKLTSGVDVWLNTPTPPLEASGTSGMKAAHNGVLNFSILDGWWIEGCIEDVTGWSIGAPPTESISDDEKRILELKDLYNKLEYLIVPKYYREKDHWIEMMKNCIGNIASYFNSNRMIERYITDAYLL